MLLCAILFFSLIALYNSPAYFHSIKNNLRKIPILGTYIEVTFEQTVNELDISKLINQTTLPNSNYVDLIFSGSDLKTLQADIKRFIKLGFISDEQNKWRKAKELINSQKLNIKYKLHGTSVSSFTNGNLNLWDYIKNLLGMQRNDVIASGRPSYKIKYSKDGLYKDQVRSYILKSSFDTFNISQIVLNQIASHMGLISPYGEFVILRINGSEVGPYYAIENYNSKEWFERNHNLTNYSAIKSNDDWDHARAEVDKHSSRTDSLIQDKEVDGSSENHDIALGALYYLLKAIDNKDIDTIKNSIDVRYTAKLMAILSVTNNLHTITGDQLRYIYDHSTGRFKFIHKNENYIFLIKRKSVENFNKIYSQKPSAVSLDAETYRMFKLLIADPEFRELRDSELLNLVSNWEELSLMADITFDENMEVLNSSRAILNPIKMNFRAFKDDFNANLNLAKKYLDYSKVFVSIFKEDANNRLSIINDSYNSVTLEEVHYSDNTIVKYNNIIAANQLDNNLDMEHIEKNIFVNSGEITKLIFKNNITGEIISQDHTYINYVQVLKKSSISDSLEVLEANNISYIFYDNKTILIDKGSYILNNNLVIPEGYSVKINPGVTIEMGHNISFVIKGSLISKGSKSLPIIIKRKNLEKPFGVFAVLGDYAKNNDVLLSHFEISGGSSSTIEGIFFSGQLSIHNSNVKINNSRVSNSFSDDGINIKNSIVGIYDSTFFDNFSDQIDLDYSTGEVINNSFSFLTSEESNPSSSTDGLDISGGRVKVVNNYFRNFSDKAISVGENSIVLIDNNNIYDSYIASAIKDGSVAFIGQNVLSNNQKNLSSYIKKKIYRQPKLFSSDIENNMEYIQYDNLLRNFNDYRHDNK